MAKKQLKVKDVNYNQEHLVEVNTEDLPTPELSAEELLSKMEGDTEEAGVNVDLSEDGEKVKVTLDQDVKDAISGNNTVEIVFTEDDWDEDEEMYVKRIEINNSFISIIPPENPAHESAGIKIFNPFFKGIACGFNAELIGSFNGYEYVPEERYIKIEPDTALHIAIFAGLITQFYEEV